MKGEYDMKEIIMNMIEDECKLILGVDNTEIEVSKGNIIKSDKDRLIVNDNHLITMIYLDTVKYFRFK